MSIDKMTVVAYCKTSNAARASILEDDDGAWFINSCASGSHGKGRIRYGESLLPEDMTYGTRISSSWTWNLDGLKMLTRMVVEYIERKEKEGVKYEHTEIDVEKLDLPF